MAASKLQPVNDRVIYIASTAVLAGLGITTGFWFAPKLHAALTQATYEEQFCLVLSTNSSSGCVQVELQHNPGGVRCVYPNPSAGADQQGTAAEKASFTSTYHADTEWPCYYPATTPDLLSFTSPPAFSGLYGSFCVALGLLAALLVCLYFLLGVGRPATAKDIEAAGRLPSHVQPRWDWSMARQPCNEVPSRHTHAQQEGTAPLIEAGNVQPAAKLRIKQNSVVPVIED